MTEPVKPEEKPDNARTLGIGFIVGVIVAVLALEYYGYIRHSDASDAARIDQFNLMELSENVDLKVSDKESGKLAFCSDGYLLMRPDNNKPVAGILVDSHNRAVRCKPGMSDE
ncbi:hypothetical protein [Parathalassolituus penaei]|uniref:Uncharacterized protein n=1 Tax=Parathalassolituus penaei TaxID=2997323 RepID=A0A9X3ISS3_9GAMM|nr:hypothetical protein [Parathalassolituus penaei]MCY0964463.1 hypothetical protein [Parathalassolituus penaei]